MPAPFERITLCAMAMLASIWTANAQTTRQTFLTDEPFQAGETLIWTPAFQKCWDELAKNVGVDQIPIEPETRYVKHLNSFKFNYEATVPTRSHFVFIAGMGDQYIEQANALIRAHFGGTVEPLAKNYFEPFGPDFNSSDNVVHRVLISILSHNHDFSSSFKTWPNPLAFHGATGAQFFAKAFGSWKGKQTATPAAIRVLHHDPVAKRFALGIPGDDADISMILLLDDSTDTVGKQIEVVRTWLRQATPDAASDSSSFIQPSDTLLIPKLRLFHHMDFADVLRGTAHFAYGSLVIARAGQTVQLTLNESGAEMVTKAFLVPPTYLSTDSGAGGGRVPPSPERQFIFDRPFTLMFWKAGAEIPFFFARIEKGSLERY